MQFFRAKTTIVGILQSLNYVNERSKPAIRERMKTSQQKGSILTDQQVAEIGNLILVDEGLNGKLGTKSFAEKSKILTKAHGVWKDDFLSKQTDWTAAEIRKRSDHLAKLAFDKVWKI